MDLLSTIGPGLLRIEPCFMAIPHSDVLPNDLCSKLRISSERNSHELGFDLSG